MVEGLGGGQRCGVVGGEGQGAGHRADPAGAQCGCGVEGGIEAVVNTVGEHGAVRAGQHEWGWCGPCCPVGCGSGGDRCLHAHTFRLRLVGRGGCARPVTKIYG